MMLTCSCAAPAVPAAQVLGDRLHCVFVDNGLLRYKASAMCMLWSMSCHMPWLILRV